MTSDKEALEQFDAYLRRLLSDGAWKHLRSQTDPTPEPELNEDTAPISHIWRAFRVEVDQHDRRAILTGAYNKVWRYSEMKAICHRNNSFVEDHDAPDERCGCGIYGWYEPGKVIEDYIRPHISYSGSILALARCEYWGKTIVGTKGVRTENARIVKLMLINSTRVQKIYGTWFLRALNDLRDRYTNIPEIIPITHDDLLTIQQG